VGFYLACGGEERQNNKNVRGRKDDIEKSSVLSSKNDSSGYCKQRLLYVENTTWEEMGWFGERDKKGSKKLGGKKKVPSAVEGRLKKRGRKIPPNQGTGTVEVTNTDDTERR